MADDDDMMGHLDRWLERIRWPSGAGFRGAIVDVLDTAEGVESGQGSRLQPSAADIVQMTALVLARETELARRETEDES